MSHIYGRLGPSVISVAAFVLSFGVPNEAGAASDVLIHLKGGSGSIRAERTWTQGDQVCWESRGYQDCLPKDRIDFTPSVTETAPALQPDTPGSTADQADKASTQQKIDQYRRYLQSIKPRPFSFAQCLLTGEGTFWSWRPHTGLHALPPEMVNAPAWRLEVWHTQVCAEKEASHTSSMESWHEKVDAFEKKHRVTPSSE